LQFTTETPLVSKTNPTPIAAQSHSAAASKTHEELAAIVSVFASSGGWMAKVRLRTERRWYERLHHGQDYDIWVISWLPGQSTGFHDHGESSGAFVVATGILEEQSPGEQTCLIHPGKPRSFGPDYKHDVRNASLAPAISIHAYSPPLSEMNEYELNGNQLVARERVSWKVEAFNQEWHVQNPKAEDRTGALTIEQMLLAERARLKRLLPEEVYEATTKTAAILVDIRPEGQRAIEGRIAGALIIERNVLEWRFDPASSARLPIATDHDIQVIVFCSEGYTSSLAAASLQNLGLWRATDMVGGFQKWRATGLPIVPPDGSS
jgi:rhodanese-related sulfurtransferase